MKIFVFTNLLCSLVAFSFALTHHRIQNTGIQNAKSNSVAAPQFAHQIENDAASSSLPSNEKLTFFKKKKQFLRFILSYEDLCKASEAFFTALKNSNSGNCPDSYAEKLEITYKQLQKGIFWKSKFSKKNSAELHNIHLTLREFLKIFRKLHALRGRIQSYHKGVHDNRTLQDIFTDDFHIILWEAQFSTIKAFTFDGALNSKVHEIRDSYEKRMKQIKFWLKWRNAKLLFPELQEEYDRSKKRARTMEYRFHHNIGRSFWA